MEQSAGQWEKKMREGYWPWKWAAWGECYGCHKARQDKKWRNQKKSKPTRDSSRSDKNETSHVVWPRIKNVRGQTANQSTTLLYREDAAEVVYARSGSIIYKRTWIVYNWTRRKRWTSYVTDKNGDIVFQPHRHHWVDGRARRRSPPKASSKTQKGPKFEQ